MSRGFKQLKAKSRSGEALALLQSLSRYNLGAHKKIRLRRAGIAETKSLLQDEVSKKHARKLAIELQARATKIGRDASKRLRFLTVLHSVERIDLQKVSAAVRRMDAAYRKVLGRLRLWSKGAVELEIVNFTLLQKIADIDDGEARKLNVLSELLADSKLNKVVPHHGSDARVLVHLHAVVDLGDTPEIMESHLREAMATISVWNKAPFQIELKNLFSNQSVSKSLKLIAAYVTKGGNERLRYNAGFGRDLGEDLDAKMWRAGLGRADGGGETIEDERGLTIVEVKKLDELYLWVMRRRKDGRGYLVSTN